MPDPKYARGRFKDRLETVEVRPTEWVRIYRDTETGDLWTGYHPLGELQGGGPELLRCGDVPDDRGAWVVRVLRAGSDADVYGAAMDLLRDFEAWDDVLTCIEADRRNLIDRRVRAFVERLGILMPMNRRAVVGVDPDVIENDAEHFRDLARRAKALI